MNKQIEEMALDIHSVSHLPLELCGALATDLFGKNYRKLYDDNAVQCVCYALGCQAAEQIKAATVRKMQAMIEERCLKGCIYPAFVKNTINKVAEELLKGD